MKNIKTKQAKKLTYKNMIDATLTIPILIF